MKPIRNFNVDRNVCEDILEDHIIGPSLLPDRLTVSIKFGK